MLIYHAVCVDTMIHSNSLADEFRCICLFPEKKSFSAESLSGVFRMFVRSFLFFFILFYSNLNNPQSVHSMCLIIFHKFVLYQAMHRTYCEHNKEHSTDKDRERERGKREWGGGGGMAFLSFGKLVKCLGH